MRKWKDRVIPRRELESIVSQLKQLQSMNGGIYECNSRNSSENKIMK